MDWSILGYFLAAVGAAGVSYTVWPKRHRPYIDVPVDAPSDEPSHEDATPSPASAVQGAQRRTA